MAWSAISCSLRSDPRLFAIDRRAAFAAVCAAYLFAAEHETDGRVPRAVLEEFAPPPVIDRLVEDGVLRSRGADVEVVAFLDTNPTHAAREIMREKDRAKKRAVRCPQGTPQGTPSGTPQGTPLVCPSATVQDSTEPTSSQRRAPAGPVADATGSVETNRKPGKGKARQPNLNGTAGHPRKRSEAQEAWDHYAARFVKRSGSPPLPEAHFFVSLDRRLKSGVTKAEIIKRVDRYFDAPPFSLREGARDFGRFLKCFDMLADVGQPEGPDLTWRGIYREDDSGTNGEVRT